MKVRVILLVAAFWVVLHNHPLLDPLFPLKGEKKAELIKEAALSEVCRETCAPEDHQASWHLTRKTMTITCKQLSLFWLGKRPKFCFLLCWKAGWWLHSKEEAGKAGVSGWRESLRRPDWRAILSLIFIFYCSVVDLQCCVHFRRTAKWFRHTHTHSFPKYVIMEYRVEFPGLYSRSLWII